uniref:D-galactoside-specific lectin n=1 Tax=Heliocidaris crassispina TaxID=1043166 RepID=LEG_HELCR|nr:RecName: Full=D-galactoside-specific lectin; AltName: Full=Sea urchin egg lectin; Short=SUEL [Heliocidaris crassispina]
ELVSEFCLKKERVCEDSSLTISCPEGEGIVIYDAIYGRKRGEVCPGLFGAFTKNRKCRSSNSQQVVENSCEGKSSCTVLASNSVFGDPCPGTAKYLAVTYICSFL